MDKNYDLERQIANEVDMLGAWQEVVTEQRDRLSAHDALSTRDLSALATSYQKLTGTKIDGMGKLLSDKEQIAQLEAKYRFSMQRDYLDNGVQVALKLTAEKFGVDTPDFYTTFFKNLQVALKEMPDDQEPLGISEAEIVDE